MPVGLTAGVLQFWPFPAGCKKLPQVELQMGVVWANQF